MNPPENKAPRDDPGGLILQRTWTRGSVHVPAHAARTARHARGRLLFLGDLVNHRLRGQHQTRDAGRVLQGGAGDLGRVDDAGLEHVDPLAGVGIEADRGLLLLLPLLHDDRTLVAGVDGDLANRLFEGAPHDVDPGLDVLVLLLELVQGRDGAHQSDTAAGDDALLDGRLGGVHGILDAGLLFLHFTLGRRPNLDDGDSADQLREPLLQLLAIVVGGRLFDLGADLLHPALGVGALAPALDDGRVVLVRGDLLGLAEVLDLEVLELDAEVLGDALAAGEDGDVLEHGLAAIAEARRLDGEHLKRAAQLVDDERRQRLTLDVLGDDHQGTSALGDLLQKRQELAHVGDLLLVDQDVRVLQHALHALGVGDEVRAQVAPIELHPLDDLEGRFEALRLLHRDHPVLADLLHRLGDDLADGLVIVRGDGADLGNGLAADRFGELLDLLDRLLDGLLDPPLEVHGVGAGGHGLDALPIDRLGQDGRRGRAVAGNLRGLARDFTHELGAQVLLRVLELDLLGHGDPVLRAGGGTELLLEDDVPAARPERHLHGPRQFVHTAQNRLSALLCINNVLRGHGSMTSLGLVMSLNRERALG